MDSSFFWDTCITEELCVCVAKIYDLSEYYLNKFGEVNYIGKKLRIDFEQKIVGCSNQFAHQKLQDVTREYEKKIVKDMLRRKWEFFRIYFNFSWFQILISLIYC
jgi:predicted nucleic acid-binding OB-fold protein